MKALDLYKFVSERKIEYHWHNEDVILFVEIYLLDEWNKLLETSIKDDEGIECRMKDGYFCFEMKHICEYYGIELKEIFKEKGWEG